MKHLAAQSINILTAILVVASGAPAFAEGTGRMQPPPTAAFPANSLPKTTAPDTADLQTVILTKINQATSRGVINSEEAASLKEKLNDLGNRENWYKSLDKPVPPAVVESDKMQMGEILAHLDQLKERRGNQPSKIPTVEPTHIGSLIASQLAANRITSLQAEHFYSRLADLESQLQSLQMDPTHSAAEIAQVEQKVGQLYGEVHAAGARVAKK